MSEVTPLHPADDEDELRAADGRVPGRRGRATRQRLLECTRDMLTTTSYRDVKVIDIAREAGTSPATFYQYFADVEAAILVLAEEMAQQGQHLTEIITDGSWTGPQAFDTSLDAGRRLPRVLGRPPAGAPRDGPRHRRGRRPLPEDPGAPPQRHHQGAGRRHPARRRRAGGLPKGLDPMAVAGTLVSMLAHTAAHQYGFEFWGIRTAKLRESMARQVSWGVTGITPPP